MDTANIHSASRSQKSNSEREIQELDTLVSYSLGEHCAIQIRSDHVDLVRGECLIYYVDKQLISLDDTMTVPPGLEEEFQRISGVKSHTVHSEDIQLYRQKDTPAQIIALVVVPERLGREYNLPLYQAMCHDYGLFFGHILDIMVEGSFKSIVLPIPGWHTQEDWIELTHTTVCQELMKRGSTLRRDFHITMVHTCATLAHGK